MDMIVESESLTSVADAIRTKGETTEQLVFPDEFVTAIQAIQSGTELNFEVVGGTTQPSNPKENTIWVNTDQEITGWVFAAEAPESPAEGMVWFDVDTSSSKEFNALKENALHVYPYNAKQYIGDAWESVECESYQGGEWVEWIRYLYKTGDTGGWVAKAIYSAGNSGGVAVLPVIVYNDDSMYVTMEQAYWAYGCIYTEEKIDLTDVDTIKVVIPEMNNGFRLAVWSAVPTFVDDNAVAITGEVWTSPAEKTLDVSSVIGKHYVGLTLHGGYEHSSYFRITAITEE